MPMSSPERDMAARQLSQHLRRLQTAGVEWLPAPDRSKPRPAEEGPSLFGKAPEPMAAVEQPERRVALALLAEEVKACTACAELAPTRTQTVFGVGARG